MKPILTVLSDPIRRPQYWRDTMLSIDVNGGDRFHKHLFVPPKVFTGYLASPISFPGGWAIHSLPENRLGSTFALLNWILDDVTSVSDTPYILYCEDDIEFARNALHAIDQIEVPSDCGLLSFCNLRESIVTDDSWIERFPGRFDLRYPESNPYKLWGSQCLKIPARSFDTWRKRPPIQWYDNSADVYLGSVLCGDQSPTPMYGQYVPSLVRHTGTVSLVHPDKPSTGYGRETCDFYEGNALDLLGTRSAK